MLCGCDPETLDDQSGRIDKKLKQKKQFVFLISYNFPIWKINLYNMKNLLFAALFAVFLISCTTTPKPSLVKIHTPEGDIIVRLYDSTIKHKQNFIALVSNGYYNGTLFHRVIEKFMIQGGDPVSKHAKPGQLLGDGDTNYTIPFEYVPSYLHKRGALAAARESDDVNPEKASSGTQFYIVQGKKFTNDELTAVELKVERRTKQYILMDLLKKSGKQDELSSFKTMVDKRDTASMNKVINKYRNAVEAEYLRKRPFRITDEQRKIYTTLGGTPHLDGAYTVFGEVVSGMEVVDKIAAAKTDTNDRPIVNVPLRMEMYKK